jgi:hypothetical protein
MRYRMWPLSVFAILLLTPLVSAVEPLSIARTRVCMARFMH